MNLFVNKKIWKELTPEQLEEYKKKVFEYYRKHGFPYFNFDLQERKKIFEKLYQFNTYQLLKENNYLKQYMLGLNLANYYMPHIFAVRCRGFRSPMEAYKDDNLLYKAIEKRIKLGDNMSDAGMRKALSWVSGTHRVSNFRPTIAKYIYDNYSGYGNILDFSAGYGGRLLAALSSNKVFKYTGVEPCKKNVECLHNIINDFNFKETFLINQAFEDVSLKEENYDLIFSSPPYFNTEEYDYQDNQSFIRYPEKDNWKKNFLEKTIEKTYNYLKNDGYLIINTANVKTYPDMEKDSFDICIKNGFKHIKTYKMTLSNLMKKGFKYEPLFVFQKS